MSAGPARVRRLPQRAAGVCLFCCLSSVGMSQLWSRSHLAEQRRAELIRLLPGKASSLRQNIRSTLALHPCAARREVGKWPFTNLQGALSAFHILPNRERAVKL